MIFSRRSALEALRLTDPVTREEIDAAWRRRIREEHEDAGGNGGDLDRLKHARNKLLSDDDVRSKATDCGKNTSCKMCGGRRYIRGKFGATPCTSCN